MRILVDLQALQSRSSGQRGIGRYARSLVEGLLRLAPEDDFVLLLNGMIGEDNAGLRRDFAAWPNVTLRLWTAARPASFLAPAARRQAAEAIREAVIAECAADIVLVTSLFEGMSEDCVTGVGDTPTAVVLYDLIPLLFSSLYLTAPQFERWYQSKIESLKKADLLLAISDCSARDAALHLGRPTDRIVTIGADVDARFVPLAISEEERERHTAGLGLTRPFLLYTGGIDHRKNIPALISAFAALSPSLIETHQFAIVCRATADEKERLLAHARAAGLPDTAVILTGYVPDDTLVALYNLCAAFIFPSWYEGFGLPVLEALRCGAAVVGANASSVPEIIGRDDALFDPHSIDDMARMIEKVLTDEPFRQSLRASAAARAARYSWDETVRHALAALRALAPPRPQATAEAGVNPKPRLAFVSPLPPQRSGISFYSATLLPALADYYAIELIAEERRSVDPALAARFCVRDVSFLRAHAERYDRVLYQFGNSHFHAHMFELLEEIPGVVVLHDFFLSSIECVTSAARFSRLLAEGHGYGALLARCASAEGSDPLTQAIYTWPTNARAVRMADGVIVHSDHARRLARHFYHAATVADWVVVPLPGVPHPRTDKSRADARARLGIAPDEVLICSFGYVTPAKLPLRLIEGLCAAACSANPKVRFVFVGDAGTLGAAIMERVAPTRCAGRVHITGWAGEEMFGDYLLAADLAVQLRTNSRGESSASVIDCLAAGLPVIVNAHGSLADLSPAGVLHIPDAFADRELAQAIDLLVDDPALRQHMGKAGRERTVAEHAPESCARAYHAAIETFSRRAQGRHRLVDELARLPSDPLLDAELAQAAADSLPSGARQRQFLIDVTELARHDANSGIQRVVRALLGTLLRDPPAGWQVEPVFADPVLGRYRYARRFTCAFLDIPPVWDEDAPIDYYAGDMLLGADPGFSLIPRMRGALDSMAQSGVHLAFIVYDLLPLTLPHCFPMPEGFFAAWLHTIARYDQLLCISRAVAEDVTRYLAVHPPANGRMPAIDWFHLGADLESATCRGPRADAMREAATQAPRRPSFLMVGTVEPRKGHALALDAMERLWAAGGNAALVIAGAQGWMVEELIERLRGHHEYGDRLIWVERPSDAELRQLYSSCSCLLAASEGEGFGLPLIEAARHGLPILARDIPVFREVAGDHASYFDGTGAETLHAALDAWLAAFQAGRAVGSRGMPWLTWRHSVDALLQRLPMD
ncbi:glycosyltransferase [Ancylobacter polymorphus]|uniref:Glycosyltransferase involved in cell wall biosynthesis n=1 Tax=Ancylobacter polymorphus TaxID=223390 RepID=A0ABU0BE28_9HYPH|nr:glycosyltransferase [Ancylobacter polymorphus]MDQ0304100.1 glycosyltransferase involved in cell wall biosynthesis [Ancylobacter polymorphus]